MNETLEETPTQDSVDELVKEIVNSSMSMRCRECDGSGCRFCTDGIVYNVAETDLFMERIHSALYRFWTL